MLKGVGRTDIDGEGQIWALLNPGRSTRVLTHVILFSLSFTYMLCSDRLHEADRQEIWNQCTYCNMLFRKPAHCKIALSVVPREVPIHWRSPKAKTV